MPITITFGTDGHDDTVKQANNGNGHSGPPTAPAESVPAKVLAFWNHDPDARLISAPWRIQESPNEQSIRESMEANGSWAGL